MVSSDVYGYPIAAGSNANLYQHEDGWTDAGLPRDVWIEAAVGGDGGKQAAVLRLQMDSGSDIGTIVRGYVRQTRDGSDVTFGPYTAAESGWTPTRMGGQDLRVRLTAASDGPWSVGRVVLDVREAGGR